MKLTRLPLHFLSALIFALSAGGAWALDPSAFTSLGANPFTVTGTYTIDSAANPPVLSRPGLGSINGVVSGGLSVFTFDTLALPAGATLQGVRNSGARPVVLLSKAAVTLAAGAVINVSGANGLNDSDPQEDGGAAGPGGSGGGGGAGDEASGVGGNGGAGSPNGGNVSGYTGNFIVPFYPGSGGNIGANSGGGVTPYLGQGGGAFGGNGGDGNNGQSHGGQAYGNLGVNLGGGLFGLVLQGGSGGGGGFWGNGGGGGGGGGAVEIGAIGAITLAGSIYAYGGNGGAQTAAGGAGGGVYVHGSSVSLTGGINAGGGSGIADLGAAGGGGGGGGRVFIYTATGLLAGGTMGNVNVAGGGGANTGANGTATLAGPSVSITINSSPAGATFTVDGTNYNSAQVLSVIAGSTHSLSTTTPQAAGAGLQRVFSNWSDGGALAHGVTPTSNTTYTANFLLAATQSSRITNAARLGDGSFQLTFTNVSGAGFTVLAATNLETPLTNWTALGPATENPPGAGRYQYTDTLAPTFLRRFYNVKSP